MTHPTDDELEAMAVLLEAFGTRTGLKDAAAAMLRACKSDSKPREVHCAKCGAPRSNHPYRHPFVSMTLKKGSPNDWRNHSTKTEDGYNG